MDDRSVVRHAKVRDFQLLKIDRLPPTLVFPAQITNHLEREEAIPGGDVPVNTLLLFEVGQAIRGFDAETQLLPQVDPARILA